MHMYNFLCSDSLLYFFLFLSTLHSVYTRDCSWNTETTLAYKLDAYMYISNNLHYITSFRKYQFKGIVRAVVCALSW